MRITVIAVLAACVVFAAALFITRPQHQTAATGAVDPRTSQLIFDASRIIALLQALIATKQSATTPIPFPPRVATTTVATSTASTTPKTQKPLTPKVPSGAAALSDTQTRLALALPTLRSALVNIICIPSAKSGLHGMSGSGVIVDSRGIILTAAHVAQYELIAAQHPELVQCTVRTGSPASNAYTAVPLFVSSSWIHANPTTVTTSQPTGTGEHDFAFLGITGSATSAPLPASFPSISLSADDPTTNEPVVVGSYGAEFLSSATIRAGIFPSFEYSTVKDRFTFNADTIDVISVGGGATAQEGSSGGGVVNPSGHLIGLITTSSVGSDIQARDLRAITIPYVARAFADETGSSLSSHFSGSTVSNLATAYTSQASSLSSFLIRSNGLGHVSSTATGQ